MPFSACVCRQLTPTRLTLRYLHTLSGFDINNFELVDTSDLFCELENTGGHNRRSLPTAFRWTMGRQDRGWHNAGNDARTTALLLQGLLRYDSIHQARWRILGAHSLSQLPNDEIMRANDAPKFPFLDWVDSTSTCNTGAG